MNIAVLVMDTGSPSSQAVALEARLDALGHTATLVDIDSITNQSQYDAYDMVVTSAETVTGGVTPWAELIEWPGVVVGIGGFNFIENMLLGTVGNRTNGFTQDINVQTAAHAISVAAGWSTGLQSMNILALDSVPAADLAGGCTVVANRSGATEATLIAAIAGGAKQGGGTFAGHRVYFGAYEFSSSADEDEVLDAILAAYAPSSGVTESVSGTSAGSSADTVEPTVNIRGDCTSPGTSADSGAVLSKIRITAVSAGISLDSAPRPVPPGSDDHMHQRRRRRRHEQWWR